jgi:hypothetical protein
MGFFKCNLLIPFKIQWWNFSGLLNAWTLECLNYFRAGPAIMLMDFLNKAPAISYKKPLYIYFPICWQNSNLSYIWRFLNLCPLLKQVYTVIWCAWLNLICAAGNFHSFQASTPKCTNTIRKVSWSKTMVCFQAHRMEYMLLLLSHGAETFGDWIQWYAQWFNGHTCYVLMQMPRGMCGRSWKHYLLVCVLLTFKCLVVLLICGAPYCVQSPKIPVGTKRNAYWESALIVVFRIWRYVLNSYFFNIW